MADANKFKLKCLRDVLKYKTTQHRILKTYLEDLDFIIDNVDEQHKPQLQNLHDYLTSKNNTYLLKISFINNKITHIINKKHAPKYL